MKKRFVVCLASSTKEQEEKFIEYLKKTGLGWWHWLPNTWLLSDSRGTLTASLLRNQIGTIFTNEYNIVLELGQNYDTWSGYGPNSENRNMFKWLNDNWNTF